MTLKAVEEKLIDLKEENNWSTQKLRDEIEKETGLDFARRTVDRWLKEEHRVRKSYRGAINKFVEEYE